MEQNENMKENQQRPLNTEDWIIIMEECFKEPDFDLANITRTTTFNSPTYGEVQIGAKFAQLKQMKKDDSSPVKCDQALFYFLRARCPQLFSSPTSGDDQTM